MYSLDELMNSSFVERLDPLWKSHKTEKLDREFKSRSKDGRNSLLKEIRPKLNFIDQLILDRKPESIAGVYVG